jgi:hypothetical protein
MSLVDQVEVMEYDEDILGPCGVRFNPEAHIPPMEYD